MEQTKLEQKVRELFEEQGFKVSEKGNRLKAENGKVLELVVFSSENYSLNDIEARAKENELVFVDEELADAQNVLENDVSIIETKKDSRDYDLPSYEIIGDIAIINELVDVDKEEAVEGILEHHPHIKTILLKNEGLKGEFRVGEYEKLYGDETETIHKEFGCRFKIDPTKAYFSERFSTERNRVVSNIRDGERVLVMFAGVGPFAIMAAKNAETEKVVAVEKNPDAAEYMEENIKLNDVQDKVKVIEGDVKDVLPDLGEFNRIIMPLPGSANHFLDLAVSKVAENGVIHYYRFLEDENWESIISEIEDTVEKTGREFSIVDKVICGHKGPGTDRVCIDIRLN